MMSRAQAHGVNGRQMQNKAARLSYTIYACDANKNKCDLYSQVVVHADQLNLLARFKRRQTYDNHVSEQHAAM